MTREEFAAAYKRLLESFAVTTQVELSQMMGVRQSSISDAKRRCRIPDSWLLTLVEKQSVNPRWVLSGDGEKYVASCVTSATAAESLKRASLQELLQEIFDRCVDKIAGGIVQNGTVDCCRKEAPKRKAKRVSGKTASRSGAEPS